ncbi:transcriptional regulator FtsR [Saccharomonospora cyanea]|uniref:Putative transcriptional regulator n=1 Tax=Saccharomonospora cyanea NA-134 TaxID=882082 RepID=H5XJS7_9PSEU|nr:MerR family transcriptional regulator [Saccharomonospora cyanea]EHR61842.1 putative transcriptional regulator [Saccharomonospora cyanea NA-134]
MTAAGRPQREGLSIGAVLAQLRPDFPDVTISKIRFLESEGLVRPARTPSGYRQFGPADVERLRFVLAAQRDHYLPLKVIKEQLDAADRGDSNASVVPRLPRKLVAITSVDDDGQVPGVPGPDEFAADPDAAARLTEDDLLREAGIDELMLDELRQYGLVRPSAAGFYDTDAVRIARTVKAMSDYGIEPRHLRAFRASADREVGLVEQIVAPVYRQRDTDAKARGDELVKELAALSVTLHTLLVKTGIRGVTGG